MLGCGFGLGHSFHRWRHSPPGWLGTKKGLSVEEGSFKLVGTGTGTLTVSVGMPIGADHKGPWEHVVAIQVEPHRTYVLPEFLLKELGAEMQSNNTDAGDVK